MKSQQSQGGNSSLGLWVSVSYDTKKQQPATDVCGVPDSLGG